MWMQIKQQETSDISDQVDLFEEILNTSPSSGSFAEASDSLEDDAESWESEESEERDETTAGFGRDDDSDEDFESEDYGGEEDEEEKEEDLDEEYKPANKREGLKKQEKIMGVKR